MESNNSLISKKFPDDRILLSVRATMLPELLPLRQGLIGTLTVTDKRFFFYGGDHPGNWIIGYLFISLFIGMGVLGLIIAIVLSDALWVVISSVSIISIVFFTILTRDIKKTCNGLSWECNSTQIETNPCKQTITLKNYRRSTFYIPKEFNKLLTILKSLGD